MQSSTVAQQAPARNLNRGWWPMLPEWSRRVLKPVLNQVAIHERLEDAGVVASEDDVQQVLLQLSDHDDIRLAGEPGAMGGLAVVYVDPELCP